MTIDIEALKAAAKAATPGNWDLVPCYGGNNGASIAIIKKNGLPGWESAGIVANFPLYNANWEADAEFAQAANPAAVLALIERLEQTERNRDMWKAQCERQAEALEKQARAAKTGMDAAKAGASAMQENARRMLAESNPDALESERQANAILTAENERLQAALKEAEAAMNAYHDMMVYETNRAEEFKSKTAELMDEIAELRDKGQT